MDKHVIEQIVKDVKLEVRESVNYSHDVDSEQIHDLITSVIFERAKKQYISASEKHELIKAVFNSICGLDVLQPLLEDDEITEIMINGPDDIFIEKKGRTKKLNTNFESVERLEDVIQAVVAKVNRSVNEACPIADARLKDGSRVSVVLPPVALNGPIMTIRKFPRNPMKMNDLINSSSISTEAAAALESMVKAKYNIFICGGTGSGKTTFLNVLSNYIPKDERVITIEDSAELQIQGIQNLVKLEVRNANTERKGEITIRDLIKTSLRMRPERIIVGEVRGAEALDMLQAMNTGHDGSLSTGHANSTKDMLSRLETMVLSGAALPLEAIRQQIASAIDIIVHLSRLRDKSRKITEITEVAGLQNGEIILNPLFLFEEEDIKEVVSGSLKRTKNKIINENKFKNAGILVSF